jgi:hypothetical protein
MARGFLMPPLLNGGTVGGRMNMEDSLRIEAARYRLGVASATILFVLPSTAMPRLPPSSPTLFDWLVNGWTTMTTLHETPTMLFGVCYDRRPTSR